MKNISFHQDIPYGYLVTACTRTALEIYQRDVPPIINKRQSMGYNSKLSKGGGGWGWEREQPFLYEIRSHNLTHIAIKFHRDIAKHLHSH